MSNWITDNKPAAMVAGVGLLLFLGLSATGYIVNSKRSELDKKISIAAKEIKSANAAEITPSRSSNEELEKRTEPLCQGRGQPGNGLQALPCLLRAGPHHAHGIPE